MDAFEKLAKLAGASVESVGEGLPRTRVEAKAMGSLHYFTGKPCKHGHVAFRWTTSTVCRECGIKIRHKHDTSPEGREHKRQYDARPEVAEKKRRNAARQEVKERMRQYNAKPEIKECKRQHTLEKTGDEILFAINQAEHYASRGRAIADIVHQCPEPQRSQLQALVDRIKADPQAGKAVIGLLRTMRELRKTELAEMQAGSCVEGASSS